MKLQRSQWMGRNVLEGVRDMILRKDLLALNFYKKEKFTGSFQGMRYLIQMVREGEEELFVVFTWPGPYNFETTLEEKKSRRVFPFTEESLEAIADYLNEAYKDGKEGWTPGIRI